MPGLAPHSCAAEEAWEEAGVRGQLSTAPAGRYRYLKQRRRGPVPAEVTLFPLRVTEEHGDWPEAGERTRRWFSRADAAAAVAESELAALISRFEPKASDASRTWPARPATKRGSAMLKLLRAIMPREDRFFDLFERHTQTLVSGADAMVRLLAGGAIEQSCAEIRDIENAADDVTRDVLVGVRRSFITPFDRSAITGLISAMDDAVDEMWQTAKAITLYEVTEFEPQMQEMSTLAAEAARMVAEAIPLMRNIGRNGARLHDLTESIVHLEGRADELHAAGLKSLYQAHGKERPMAFFVGREIFSYIERVLDRLEDVADEIQGIVIDHA
jgi:predicted phosphate transport protein (TIGR00153 family)